MRFGKRNRSPLIWGRRARAASDNAEFQPVASEERDALLNGQPEGSAGDADAEGLPLSGDPTQRLLTVLGRFEREMLKGKDGAPQNTWSDAAMRQLCHAVEIAYDQGWRDMVEALRETARILQTYEDAGRANDSVSFLADSYEILCLMVGDLIVDKVRSGVMRKWRERYEQVLEDVAADGLELVQDEQPDDEPVDVSSEPQATDEASPFDTNAFDEPSPTLSDTNLPDFGDIAMSEEPQPDEEPIDEALLDLESSSAAVAEQPAPAEEVAPAEESPVEETAYTPADDVTDLDDIADLDDALLAAQAGEAPVIDDSVLVGEAIPEEAGEEVDASAPDTQMADILDALCEGLKRLEKSQGGDMQTTFVAMEEGLDLLEQQAAERDRDAAAGACRQMKRLCGRVFLEEQPATDRFFELAYAFCGAYAPDGEDDSAAAGWTLECGEFIDAWTAEPETAPPPSPEPAEESVEEPSEQPVEEPMSEEPVTEDVSATWPLEPEISPEPEEVEPAAAAEDVPAETDTVVADFSEPAHVETVEPADQSAAEVDEDSPQHLLETARNAATLGNAGDAKLFALQAASRIARAQADQASRRVQEAEVRLQEGAQAIEEVRGEVIQSETEVSDAEQAVAASDENVQARTDEVTAAEESLASVQQTLDDLDAQLRELQARRDETAEKREATETSLAEAREKEAEARAERDREADVERQARVRLEDARQRVKGLERKRAEIESAMEKARELLTRQRASVADIERTIQEIQNAESGEGGDGSDLLF